MVPGCLNIFVQLLFLMVSLVLVGEPLRIFLSRYSSFIKDLDFLQIIVLDVYLGALIFYLIASIPFPLFNKVTTWGIVLVSLGLTLYVHALKLRNLSLVRVTGYIRSSDFKTEILVLSMFLFALLVVTVPLTNFIFGSVHDAALHSLFVEVIIEKGYIPETLGPYLPQGIIYPQAHSVVCAYASYILGYTPPLAVFYVASLFSAMTVLGAYFLGRSLGSQILGISFAFVMAFVSLWPKRITWGANAWIYGFAMYFICLSFLLRLLREPAEKKNLYETIIIGLLFGYLAASYLPFYESLMGTLIILTLVTIFRRRRNINFTMKKLSLAFIFSIFIIIVPISRFVKWYSYPGHNIGVPVDYQAPTQEPFQIHPFAWFEILRGFSIFEENWLSHYPNITVELLALLAISVVAIPLLSKTQYSDTIKSSIDIIVCSLIGITISIFMASLLISLIPTTYRVVAKEAFIVAIVLSLYLVVGVLNTLLYQNVKRYLKKKTRARIMGLPSHRFNFQTAKIWALFVSLLLINAPFVYYAFTHDCNMISSTSIFNVTTEDDYKLMLWMRNNLPRDATILINPYDAGNYIPSVSHLKIIYPFHSAGRRSLSYQRLLNFIFGGNLNGTVFELMKHFNIDYVFVGAKVTYWWEGYTRWDPLLFLNHPNFTLVKNIGRSYVFAVSY